MKILKESALPPHLSHLRTAGPKPPTPSQPPPAPAPAPPPAASLVPLRAWHIVLSRNEEGVMTRVAAYQDRGPWAWAGDIVRNTEGRPTGLTLHPFPRDTTPSQEGA